MHLNQLKYFISVAEHQSFTKAANQFYISQTAITQQIQALENNIGTPLIDRTTRPISLTSSGKTFLIEAKSILRHMETAMMRTREASQGLMGNIRIGYTKGYEQSNLPKRLRNFRKRFPNILITCYRNDTDTLATSILNKEYDIIFTWDSTNIRQENALEIRDIETVPLYVAMHTRHPFARRESLTRQDLKGENILFMSPSETGDSIGDAHYIDLYQKAGFQPNIIIRTNDYESILMMVAAEEGISIMPEYCIGQLRSVDNITYRPLAGEEETEEVLAVWHKENVTPALQHFIDEL